MKRNREAEKALTKLLTSLQEYIDVISEAYFTAAQRVVGEEVKTLAKGGLTISTHLVELTTAVTNLVGSGRLLLDVTDLMQARRPEISFMQAMMVNQERDGDLIEGAALKRARKKLITSAEFFEAVVKGQGGFA